MILYLVRHGRSFANEDGLVTGTTADTLTPRGVRQVERLKEWLRGRGMDAADRYITSQWRRAQQTAEILRPEVAWEIDARIGETDAGEAAPWKLSEFLSRYPDFYQSPSNCYPLGESHDELNVRVIDWFDELLGSSSGQARIMMVAHSGPISCILQHVSGVSMDRFPAFVPTHASLSIVNVPDNRITLAEIEGFSMQSGDQ